MKIKYNLGIDGMEMKGFKIHKPIYTRIKNWCDGWGAWIIGALILLLVVILFQGYIKPIINIMSKKTLSWSGVSLAILSISPILNQ